MKRRQFILLLAGTAGMAPAARAQQAANIRRIGLLSPFSPANTARWEKARLLGLRLTVPARVLGMADEVIE
jgi:hypothetical protein